MKKNNFFSLLLALLLTVIPWVYLFLIWNELPAVIPMHFGLDGQPDDFGPKNNVFIAPSVLSVVTLLAYFLLQAVARYNERRSMPGNAQALSGIAVVLVLFLSGVSLLLLYWTLQQKITAIPVLLVGICLLLAYIGNRMHSIKPNHFMGFRISWTLRNEEVWRKTHHFASRLWFLGYILLAVVLLFLSMPVLLFVFGGGVVVMLIVPVIYAYNVHIHVNR